MMARLRYKDYRGVINGKAGKAAALAKISDMLTLSQSGGTNYVRPLQCMHGFA